MRTHHIRHLPVLDRGALVGIVSQRDLLLHERLSGGNTEETIGDAMSDDVVAVTGDASLEQVADAMAAHKHGSIVVTDSRGGIEGIFTTVDALHALADLVRRID